MKNFFIFFALIAVSLNLSAQWNGQETALTTYKSKDFDYVITHKAVDSVLVGENLWLFICNQYSTPKADFKLPVANIIGAYPATNPAGYISGFLETDPNVSAWAKASTKPSYTKADIGLSNVNDTSDLSKPVSTATQTALDLKANASSLPQVILNNASVGLSKSTLNSTYPSVPVGTLVLCPSIILGGAVYIKATENGSSDVWQTISAPPTL